jgi:hypothetical protein
VVDGGGEGFVLEVGGRRHGLRPPTGQGRLHVDAAELAGLARHRRVEVAVPPPARVGGGALEGQRPQPGVGELRRQLVPQRPDPGDARVGHPGHRPPRRLCRRGDLAPVDLDEVARREGDAADVGDPRRRQDARPRRPVVGVGHGDPLPPAVGRRGPRGAAVVGRPAPRRDDSRRHERPPPAASHPVPHARAIAPRARSGTLGPDMTAASAPGRLASGQGGGSDGPAE